MNKKLFGLLASLSVFCAISCERELTQTTTEFKSSDIPELIPFEGGTYKISLEKVVETLQTKSVSNTNIAWAYRVNYDDEQRDAVVFNEPMESVEVTIEANHNAFKRSVVVGFSSDNEKTWKDIATSIQDLDPSKVKDVFSEFQGTNLPEKVSYNGGDFYFSLKFRLEDPQLKGVPETTFIPWAYRISINGVAGEAVQINEKTEKVNFHIDANYTASDKTVALELANNKACDNWTEVASAKQEGALIELGEEGITYFYAKADLVVKDGKFALAEAPHLPGYFFKHESIFGVPAEDSYAGYAYNPEKIAVGLADIKENAGEDPCSALSPELRLPSYEELYNLYYMEDIENTSMVEGVNGVHYRGSELFLPFNGYVNIASGALMGKNQTGARWGLGSDYNDNGMILTSNLEYSIAPSYDLVGENLASVRCVKNIALPSYVSHEPATIETSKETPITVVTNPGGFQLYDVALESDKGQFTKTGATDKKTTVTIYLPENELKEVVTWKLFVNSIFTGVTFTQPEMKDYVIFKSYSPTTAQDHNSFKLKVTIDTDHDVVPIKAVSSTGTEVCENASKDNLTVELTIPENKEKKELTWTIYVDGESTKKTIKQGAAPVAALSVEWSEGYLTVKDGKYCFMAPDAYGTYFQWKSKYAITTVPYNGKAYGPEETAFAKMANIPIGDVDPCSLVEPAGTWRMPSVAECEELFACPSTAEAKKKGTITLPDGRSLVFAPGGQVSGTTGKGMSLGSAITFWTSDEHATDKAKARYAMWSTTVAGATPKVTPGVAKVNGESVRCVKSL